MWNPNKVALKQSILVDECLLDLKATRTYRDAGHKIIDNVAEANSSRMLIGWLLGLPSDCSTTNRIGNCATTELASS